MTTIKTLPSHILQSGGKSLLLLGTHSTIFNFPEGSGSALFCFLISH